MQKTIFIQITCKKIRNQWALLTAVEEMPRTLGIAATSPAGASAGSHQALENHTCSAMATQLDYTFGLMGFLREL